MKDHSQTRSSTSDSSKTASVSAKSVALEQSKRLTRPARLVFYFVLISLTLVVLSSIVRGQEQYKVHDVNKNIDENLDTVQRYANAYASATNLGNMNADNKKAAEFYFQRYVPTKMSRPDSLDQMTDLMKHVSSAFERASRANTPAKGFLVKSLSRGMKLIAEGNYHPPARVNAILFLANMSDGRTAAGLPRPYGVLPILLPIYQDEKAPEAARAAALKGMDRYVRYSDPKSIAPQLKQTLTDEMTKLLDSEAPDGRSEMVHAFLQRYAVNILGNLATDASFGKQLISVSTKEDAPNLIAFHSASALASLPKAMAAGEVETDEVLKQWSRRILTAYQGEIDRLMKMEKMQTTRVQQPGIPESFMKKKSNAEDDAAARAKMAGGMMGDDYGMMGTDEMMGMEGMDMMGTDEMMGMEGMSGMEGMMGMGMGMRVPKRPKQPPEIVASRRELNFMFQQLLRGVIGDGSAMEDEVEDIQAKGGIMVASSPDKQEAVKSWLGSVKELLEELNSTTISTRQVYLKSLKAQLEPLQDLADGKAATVNRNVGGGFTPFDLNSGGAPGVPGEGASGLPMDPSDPNAPGGNGANPAGTSIDELLK